jgi:hypothetical protein
LPSPAELATLRRVRLRALSLAFALPTLAACGHPATREECSLILDKSAELKLREQDITDPAVIEERLKAFRETRGDELLEKCVGRTITKSAISCVQRAESASAVDRCLY